MGHRRSVAPEVLRTWPDYLAVVVMAHFVFDRRPPLEPQALEAAVDELVGHLRARSPAVQVRIERPT